MQKIIKITTEEQMKVMYISKYLYCRSVFDLCTQLEMTPYISNTFSIAQKVELKIETYLSGFIICFCR